MQRSSMRRLPGTGQRLLSEPWARRFSYVRQVPALPIRDQPHASQPVMLPKIAAHSPLGVLSCQKREVHMDREVPPPPKEAPSLVAELKHLQNKNALYVGFLRFCGVFSNQQWQRAAGTDLLFQCMKQGLNPALYSSKAGNVDARRFYCRFMLSGIHCWLVHVGMRKAPAETWEPLLHEMLEGLWDRVLRDMVKEEDVELLHATKFLKDMQLTWHGTVLALDEAIESDTATDRVSEILLKNVYTDSNGELEEGAKEASMWLAKYIEKQVEHMRSLPAEEIKGGTVTWAPLPEV
eukprot:6211946-Pleurochrysis_carterae.AAC.2